MDSTFLDNFQFSAEIKCFECGRLIYVSTEKFECARCGTAYRIIGNLHVVYKPTSNALPKELLNPLEQEFTLF